jgi:AraC-like DNA-binding protein
MDPSTAGLLRRAAGLLRRHPRLRTRDAEELGAYLRVWGYQLDIEPRDVRQLDARINSVFLPRMALGYYHYGAKVKIQTNLSNDDYWILRPIRGPLEMITGKTAVDCGPGCAAVVSPTRQSLFRSQDGSTRLHLRVYGAALTRQLVALLGEPLDMPLEFALSMDLGEGYGRSLAKYLHLAVTDFDQSGSILQNPVTLSSFEEFVLTGLLLSHPHNYTGLLSRSNKPAVPRDVKRAIDYMHANLDAAIGLPEIAAASGVPGRTLLQHFRDFTGTGPIRYLRHARYEKVREVLRQAEPEESITEIAARCGFNHMGRFSVEYRRRFGESPSATVRRRRNAPGPSVISAGR